MMDEAPGLSGGELVERDLPALPMPHEYTSAIATRELVLEHKFLVALFLCVTALLYVALAKGMLNSTLPIIFTVGVPTTLFTCSRIRRERVRRERRLALLERAGSSSRGNLESPAIEDDVFSFGERFKIRVMAIVSENRTRLVGIAGAIVGCAALLGLATKSAEVAITTALTMLFLIGLAGAFLLLRDLIFPNDEIKREITATENFRLTQERGNEALQGSLSLSAGEGEETKQGALSISADQGAITQVDD